MPLDAPGPSAPGLLFALRLRPSSPQGALQGEVEQVLSGERCRFVDEGELLSWLQAHSRTGPDRPPLPRVQPGPPADPGPGGAARDATT